MEPSASVPLSSTRASSRLFRIRRQNGVWHVVELLLGNVGGFFSSLESAVTFARSEALGAHGARVVIELEGAA